MSLRAWLIVGCVACGHHADDRQEAPPPQRVGSAHAVDAGTSAPIPARALPPATELLAAVPADAPFAFVTLEPSDLPQRLLAELDAGTLRAAANAHTATLDPIARLTYAGWAEVAHTLGSPDPLRGLGLGRRFVAYGAGSIPVVRVELVDPAVATTAVARVMKAAGQVGAGPTWIVDAGATAELVAVAANQLVVARGPREVIHARSAQLLGAAATPITDAALRALASSRGLDVRGVGWIDPARIAAIVATPGAIPAFDDLALGCRTEVAAALGAFDRIAFGITEITRSRIAIAASVSVAAATSTALDAATKAAPSLPAALDGKPMIALSIVAPPVAVSASWVARGKRLSTACGQQGSTTLPAPWDTVRAAAIVVYGAKWAGLFPGAIDGYAGLDAPDVDAIGAAIAKSVPGFAAPKDAALTKLSAGALADMVKWLAVGRRGDTLVVTTGPLGAAHVAELAHHDASPLFRLFVDVARLRQPGDTRDDDDQFFTAGGAFEDEAGLDHVRDVVFGAVSIIVDVHPGELRATLAADANPHAPRSRPSTDPRAATRDQCRMILRRALATTAPALAKLGVVDQLDELATTYTTSIEATSAIRSCATLPATARACLANAPNVIAAAASCAPDATHFNPSQLELPPLFSFFGPNPLDARIHPTIDGHAVLAKLVGTWVRKGAFNTETWKVDAAGNLVDTLSERGSGAPTMHTFKLGATHAGQLEKISSDGSVSTIPFFMPTGDQFTTDVDGAPIASEDRFVVALDRGFLVRDPTGCWFVTREGALVDARCTQQRHELAVAYRPPCSDGDCDRTEHFVFQSGWILPARATDASFVRQK